MPSLRPRRLSVLRSLHPLRPQAIINPAAARLLQPSLPAPSPPPLPPIFAARSPAILAPHPAGLPPPIFARSRPGLSPSFRAHHHRLRDRLRDRFRPRRRRSSAPGPRLSDAVSAPAAAPVSGPPARRLSTLTASAVSFPSAPLPPRFPAICGPKGLRTALPCRTSAQDTPDHGAEGCTYLYPIPPTFSIGSL